MGESFDALAGLRPQRIVVSREAFDAFLTSLDRPAEPCPALVRLFSDPDLRDTSEL